MDEKEQIEAISFLDSLRWPSDQTGYLMSSESNLPPYRILSKMLREKQIPQKMTWNKAQCIEELGGIQNVNSNLPSDQNIISQKLVQNIQNELALQNQLINDLHDLIHGNDEEILQLLEEEENMHIQEQQKMFS